MHSEDSVSFNCHVNVSSGWEYLWYKDDKELVLPGNNYNITSVTTKDSGSYKCKVSRGTEISKLSNIVKLKVEGTFFKISLFDSFGFECLLFTFWLRLLQSAQRLL